MKSQTISWRVILTYCHGPMCERVNYITLYIKAISAGVAEQMGWNHHQENHFPGTIIDVSVNQWCHQLFPM